MKNKRYLNTLIMMAILFGFSCAVFSQSQNTRGQVISVTALGSLSTTQLDAMKPSYKMNFPPSKNAISLFRILYTTLSTQGEITQASGLMIVPSGVKTSLPVISFQHGVALTRSLVPSSAQTTDVFLIAAYFGASGYLTVAPDYLGLGHSQGFHPYLHADSEATAAADLLSAAHLLASEQKLQLSGKLFLAGYSQGAHATMALHRYLENSRELALDFPFQIIASSAMSGPYDLSSISFPLLLTQPAPGSSVYLAYLLNAMNSVYKIFPDYSTMLRNPYDQILESLFDGNQSGDEIVKALPTTPDMLLQPAFIEDVLNNTQHPLIAALKKNDVYDWKPVAPIHFYYGKADRDVPPKNAIKAYTRMKELGADVQLINVGDELDHQSAVGPSFFETHQWFETFNK